MIPGDAEIPEHFAEPLQAAQIFVPVCFREFDEQNCLRIAAQERLDGRLEHGDLGRQPQHGAIDRLHRDRPERDDVLRRLHRFVEAAEVAGAHRAAAEQWRELQLDFCRESERAFGTTARQVVPITFGGVVHSSVRDNEFGDGQGTTRESHLVVDFRAGKDVGLGLFGAKGMSVFSAGVRFAQFTSGSDVTLHARPTYVSSVPGRPGKYTFRYHHFHYQHGDHPVQAEYTRHWTVAIMGCFATGRGR